MPIMQNPVSPLLSICIPTWNRASYLEVCLRSVQEELSRCPWAAVEVVVSDNASSDGTQTLCEAFVQTCPQIRYFRNPENIGGHGNIDLVVTRAQGTYCWYLGDDDALLPGSLRIVLEHLQEQRDIYLSWAVETDANLTPLTESAYWYREPMTRFTYDLGDEQDLLEYISQCQYMAGLFAFISILIFRKSRWEQQQELRDIWGWTEYSHMISFLGMTRQSCPFRFIPDALVYKRLGNDRWADALPWGRMYYDIMAWGEFAKTLFETRPALRKAFHEVIRRNHGPGIISGLRNTSCEDDWQKAKHWLMTEGYDPLIIQSVEMGWLSVSQRLVPPPGLNAATLTFGDQGFLLRGARRITLLVSGSIQNQLTAVSLLSALHQLLPVTQFQVFAPESCRPLLGGSLDSFNFEWISEGLLRQQASYLAELTLRLARFAPDAILNGSPQREPALDFLVKANRAAVKLGFRTTSQEVAPNAFDASYSRLLEPSENPVDQVNAFLGEFGFPTVSKLSAPWEQPDDVAAIEDLLIAQGWTDRPLVLLAAEPIEHMPQSLAQALAQSPELQGFPLIAIGSTRDEGTLQVLLQNSGVTDRANLTGQLSLGQMAVLMRKAKLVISGENDLAHLACACHVPHLLVSGGGTFASVFPYQASTTVAVRPLACFFCQWIACPHQMACIHGLSFHTIRQAIHHALKEPGAVPRVVAQSDPLHQIPAAMDLGPLLNPNLCTLILAEGAAASTAVD